jgi:hypothetical protein
MSKATPRPQGQVETFIQRATPPVRPLLRQLRKIVRDTLPGAREEIKWGRPVYSLRRIVCYLAAAKDHASLGFYRGADLRAPNVRLEGEGKKLRHIKVRQAEDIRPRVIARLLRQAARLDKG